MSRINEPAEWSNGDLVKAGLPARSLKKARIELGHPPPYTVREVYWLIERSYQLWGAFLYRGIRDR